MRIEVNRQSTNRNQGSEYDQAFHVVMFQPRFNQAQLLQDFADPPLLIANMSPMPDKCAARL